MYCGWIFFCNKKFEVNPAAPSAFKEAKLREIDI